MRINKRRQSAYRFLKHRRLLVSGRGKMLVFDISEIPQDMNIEEFLKRFRRESSMNCYNIVNSK